LGGNAQKDFDAKALRRRGDGGCDGAVETGGAVLVGGDWHLKTGGQRRTLEVVPAIQNEFRAAANLDTGGQPEPEPVAEPGDRGGGAGGRGLSLQVSTQTGRVAAKAKEMAGGVIVEEFEEREIRLAGGVLPHREKQAVRGRRQAQLRRDAIPGDAWVLEKKAIERAGRAEILRSWLGECAGQSEQEDGGEEAKPHALIVPQFCPDY